MPEIACQHHEKLNGTGYPDGLTGDRLILGSRIIAVADVFDALTSRRDYPKYAFGHTMDCEIMPISQVLNLLRDQAGSQFDGLVVDAFVQTLPHLLLNQRGKHFPAAYVDEAVRELKPELMP